MYEGMGYSVYRRVRQYYTVQLPDNQEDEDAFGQLFLSQSFSRYSCVERLDMRKPLSRDTGRRSVRANGRDMIVSASSVS